MRGDDENGVFCLKVEGKERNALGKKRMLRNGRTEHGNEKERGTETLSN